MGQSEIPGSPIAQLQGVQALDGWCKSWFCHGGLPRMVCITLAVAEGEWHCPLEKEARENNLKKFEKNHDDHEFHFFETSSGHFRASLLGLL